MAVINESFQEKIFGAEKGSAAKLDKARLDRYRDIAAKMFNTPVLSRREMAFPAIADFASALLRGLDTYRTLYFVNVLKIDMVYVTAILTLIGIYDVMNNPLMGIIYDRTRTRWGKARPYLIFTPLPYFATTALLYSGALFLTNDQTDDPKKIIFVFLTLFAQETFATIYSIPRDNMTSLMSPNPKDRITLGLVTNYAGFFASQTVYGLFLPLQDLNRWGITNVSMPVIFAIFGYITCFFGVLGNMATGVGCRERIILQPKPAPFTKTIFYILKNKYALRNFIAEFSTNWWSGGGYSWDVVTQLEIFGGAFRSALFYQPYNTLHPLSITFIPKFQKFFKNNNKRAYLALRVWDLLTGVGKFATGYFTIENPWLTGATFSFFHALNAVNNAPATVFEEELRREINDYTEYVTGERPDGTFNLLTGLISKVTSPLNALMTIAVFRWSGYDPTIPMAPWSQGNKVVYRKVYFLFTTFGILPDIIRMLPYFFYDLEGKKREQMYIELNERRALIANEKANEISEELGAVIEVLEQE
ncbi:MAG TPA: MFS transporter [Clostridiales bacterium]|nr:MFS transporter [Clostridiales bacterium]